MHEFSLARGILREVQAICRSHAFGRVRAVTMEMGEFSGIESTLLQSAFEELSAESLGYPVELIVQSVPLAAECNTCSTRFRIVDFDFCCPNCNNVDVRITSGEELKLVDIRIDRREVCL